PPHSTLFPYTTLFRSDHWGPGFEVLLLLFFRNFLNHFLFEGDNAHDSAEGFGEAGGRGNVERLVDRGKNAAIEKFFQDIFGAHRSEEHTSELQSPCNL